MNTHDEALSATFCRVIEQLAFMFAEPAEKEAIPTPDGECVSVAMRFEGALAGGLRLAVPAAMCGELAGNMLGMDPDDEQAIAKGLDALKELLNVICGNILTDIAGEEAVFSLSIPTSQALTAAEWAAFQAEPATLGFQVDEHPALLQLAVKG
ncbi:MAG: chemotaxis protein CheX [Candidatus Sumerlaeia bacterium]